MAHTDERLLREAYLRAAVDALLGSGREGAEGFVELAIHSGCRMAHVERRLDATIGDMLEGSQS